MRPRQVHRDAAAAAVAVQPSVTAELPPPIVAAQPDATPAVHAATVGPVVAPPVDPASAAASAAVAATAAGAPVVSQPLVDQGVLKAVDPAGETHAVVPPVPGVADAAATTQAAAFAHPAVVRYIADLNAWAEDEIGKAKAELEALKTKVKNLLGEATNSVHANNSIDAVNAASPTSVAAVASDARKATA